jgi:hypothetical protein
MDLLASVWNHAVLQYGLLQPFANAIMQGGTMPVTLQTQDVNFAKKNLNNGRHMARFRVLYISTLSLPFVF